MPQMELSDLFWGLLYLAIFYALAYMVRSSVTNKYTRQFFIPALTLKFVGAIGLGVIYQFYYHGGDTFNYFYHVKVIGSAFSQSFGTGFKMIFAATSKDPSFTPYVSRIFWQVDSTEYFVVRIAAFFGILCFNSYIAISLFFAVASFSGIWALYMTMAKIRPHVYKELAWTMFYVPSLFFWGSGLMKDSLCIGALGWLFYGFYRGTIEKRNVGKSLSIALLAAYLLLRIKVYILLCFLPAALLWVFNENSARIKNATLRMLAKPVFFALGGIIAFYAATNLTKGDERFDVDKIGERSKITATYLYETSVKQEGSGYYLGKQDGTLGGMAKLAPQAIIVSLFRPFLWEARNPVMLLSALEAGFFLFFTLRIFWRTGVGATFKLIGSTPILLMSFVFSLIFAASVGITSANFGTLVRYKIPLIPFYLSALYILQSIANEKRRAPVRRVAAAPQRQLA
ncbi:hypothetical protein FNT36_18925 [Hymenobacter setariae]|uniref:Glycosyltransferase RgtA/B/C/D-like domain-containing protein n=1 Tax=Hymenobacter setariae TaxID=2594794 RepID=A0A558BP37_9BACT|nr:hypothetical protein [Hymenobacter setariae]TVT38274.1 hypothetical protein FNT36_18925 [Hymenobacter setariae]